MMMKPMKVPLCVPDILDDEIMQVSEVIKSGWLAEGPKNKQLEEDFAKYIGVKKAASLNSCTSALQLAIIASDLKGEIIVPSFTFVASANSIVTSNCRPVFVDVEYDSCNVDPSKIESKIADKTVAIMPVHFAGQSCKMDEIMEIAQKHNLKVIEDSAECIGGLFNGKKTGSFGIGCFSFYPTKNITTGEGGMVTTNDEELIRNIAVLRGHGIDGSAYEREKKEKPWLRAASYAGFNFRLCDVLAALGIGQLKRVDEMNDKRRGHASYLNKELSKIEEIDIPVEQDKCKHVYQMYTLKLAKGIGRVEFVKELRKKGIMASVHFDPPVHLQPHYRNFGCKDLEVTEKLSESIVTLPMFPQLTKEQLDFMIDSVGEVVKSLK